jgi:hypothetical protein
MQMKPGEREDGPISRFPLVFEEAYDFGIEIFYIFKMAAQDFIKLFRPDFMIKMYHPVPVTGCFVPQERIDNQGEGLSFISKWE